MNINVHPDREEPSRIDIDPGRLDEEVFKHPQEFRDAARLAADARADHTEAKATLEVIRAEIQREVQLNPLAFGIEGKPTVSAIEAAVVLDKRVRRAVKRMNDAKHRLDLCEVDVSTLEQRKKMLELAVQLHLANYFSAPRVQGDTGERVAKAQRDAAFGRKKR